MIGKKVLVRGIGSGVYFGTLVSNEKDNVVLEQVRNLWYYDGANNLSDVAVKGILNESSNVSRVVEEMAFTDIVQIIPCSEKAISSIENADIWSY